MIKVFLASSSNYRFDKEDSSAKAAELKNIIESIKVGIHREMWDDQVSITPWWNCIKFKTAGEVLEALIDIVHEYDLGIFVFGKDNMAIEKEQVEYFPNNNVLIELGMFKVMGKKTFIIEDGSIIKPSDINNAKTVKFSETDNIVDGFVETIKNIKKDSRFHQYDNACVYYDYNLPNKFINFNDSNKNELQKWCTKSLFVGTKSAFLWNIIEERESYNEHLVVQDFAQRTAFLETSTKIDNIISFGPGVGRIDESLMECPNIQPNICYIPIDLNASLVIKSVQRISKMGKQIPFAVIDDFEENACYPRLAKLIEQNRNKIGKNNLFSMLGVTFSNLAMNCSSFCSKMNVIMQDKEDHLLLDVIVYDNIDSKLNTEEELKKIVSHQINDEYWEIIRNSIVKKGLSKAPKKHELKIKFDTFNNSNDINKYTKIPGTKILSVTYKDNVLFIAKYYKFNEIKNFFEKQFDVVDSKIYAGQLRGVFLLKKKASKKGRKVKIIKN